MKKAKCQAVEPEVLHDGNGRRERPWAFHKLSNSLIAAAYDEFDERMAAKMRDCANYLQFAVLGDGKLKLRKASFCRARLCPMCSWRRSLKTYGQLRAIMDDLATQDYAYIFLTLTVRNCSGSELAETLNKIFVGFNRLSKYKEVARVVRGAFRACEITHNLDTNEYHPHLHCIIAVNPSYFHSRDYISQFDWSELWRRALKVDYTPIVDVRRCYGSAEHCVAECAKYSTKAAEIICYDDWDLTVDTVRILDHALKGRRLTGYYGAFREAHKKLHLDDNEDGNLTHVEAKQISDDDNIKLISYAWHSGYCQYVRRKK